MDITTHYLGLHLVSPLIPGSSPLTDSIDNVQRLEDHGAGAIVLHSLYEEQITYDMIGRLFYDEMYTNTSVETPWYYPKPSHFVWQPEEYLQHIHAAKKAVKIPIIASLNCTTRGRWEEYVPYIQEAGADALEVNIYFVPTDPTDSGAEVEDRVVDIVSSIRTRTSLPLALKLSPFYTSFAHLVRRVEKVGANGLVLFNRFYQADIDTVTRAVIPVRTLSTAAEPTELRLRLRWLALLSEQTKLSLALTGGAHTGFDAIKGIMAGAHVVQIVSSLLRNGPEYIGTILQEMASGLEDLHVESVAAIQGCMKNKSSDPSAVERGSYLSIVHDWDSQRDASETLRVSD